MSPHDKALATQATLDRWRDVPLDWVRGDCVRMAVDHARRCGHDIRLSRAGSWATALGAKRALRRWGAADLSAALDAVPSLLRLPAPAFAMTGDLVVLPGNTGDGARAGTTGLDALAVYLGNGAILGWHPDAPGCCVQNHVTMLTGAWRV